MNSRCKHTDCIEVHYSNFWTFYATAGSKRELNYSLLLNGSRFTVPSFPVRPSGSRSYILRLEEVPYGWPPLGLSTGCSRFSKRFLLICPKVAQQLLFVTKVARKKKKFFFGLMLKYANCTAKVRFLSILCYFAI